MNIPTDLLGESDATSQENLLVSFQPCYSHNKCIKIRKDHDSAYILIEPFLLRMHRSFDDDILNYFEAAYIPTAPTDFKYTFKANEHSEIDFPHNDIVDCGNFTDAKKRIFPMLTRDVVNVGQTHRKEVVTIHLLELSESESVIKTLSSHIVQEVTNDIQNYEHRYYGIETDLFTASLTHCAWRLRINSRKKELPPDTLPDITTTYICLMPFKYPEIKKLNLKRFNYLDSIRLVNDTVFYTLFDLSIDDTFSIYRLDFINQMETIIFSPTEYCKLYAIDPVRTFMEDYILLGNRFHFELKPLVEEGSPPKAAKRIGYVVLDKTVSQDNAFKRWFKNDLKKIPVAGSQLVEVYCAGEANFHYDIDGEGVTCDRGVTRTASNQYVSMRISTDKQPLELEIQNCLKKAQIDI